MYSALLNSFLYYFSLSSSDLCFIDYLQIRCIMDDYHNSKKYMKLTETQKEIVDRYYEATKDNPHSRMPIEKLLGMRSKIPKYRPDNYLLKKIEQERLEEDDIEEITAKRGRPKKQIKNTIVLEFLSPYFDCYRELCNEYYWLDDIFTGVSRLDLGGNTRDLSKYHLFDILSVCATIDVDVLQQYLNVGERQAQKVLMSLGIAHRMLEREIILRNLLDSDKSCDVQFIGADLEVPTTYIGDGNSLLLEYNSSGA